MTSAALVAALREQAGPLAEDVKAADVVAIGLGGGLRLLVLVLYAPIARILNLSLEAALVSLVTFFFLTMMAEPLLLELSY